MELLIAGGGPAALEGALAVQRLAGERVGITLLSDRDEFVYRPVAVAEPFGLASPQRFSLTRFAQDRGIHLELGRLDSVDPSAGIVRTDAGAELRYDALLLALGARAEEAVPGALTFGGPQDSARLRAALERLHAGEALRVAFVAAPGTAWTLPLYELALMTTGWAEERGLAIEPWLVTWERRPLVVFGDDAASDVANLLADAGVRLWTGAFAEAVEDDRLWISLEGGLPVDLAVALPRPVGPHIPGLPADGHGFVPVDEHGRVPGVPGVYAAGDMTTRPLKQGGLATQQADAAAAAIAAAAGADVEATAYRPVLRAMLLTGGRPRYLRHAPGDAGVATDDAPWWPPHKIAGRELAPLSRRPPGVPDRARPLLMSSTPLRVLVAGGGIAGLEAIVALDALAGDRVAIDLLAPVGDFVQRPWSVRSPFSGEAAPHVPLNRLPARRHAGALAAVDADAHTVTTTDGGELAYDRLLVTPGARAVEGVPGATTFRGPISAGLVEGALRRARERALFVLAPDPGWTLPIYELALLAAHEFPLQIAVVTPELRPLDVFGPVASDALARLLDRAGIDFIGDTRAAEVLGHALVTDTGRMIGADAVIALPSLLGPRIEGLPCDADGFLEIDAHARVRGVRDVFAAGDATAGEIKQGGLATQQADAAAEALAAEAGAPVRPRPYRRVLRGVVLTGEEPLYLRRDLDDDSALVRPLRGAPPGVSRVQLWWPSGKVAGRYLTGFVAAGGVPGETLTDRPKRRIHAPTTRR